MNRRNEVLVGVDGSKESDAAVAWAATEARARGCGLAVVHACDPQSYGLWITPKIVREGLRELARPLVDKAVAYAKQLEPEVPVRGGVLVAAPSRTLIRLSKHARLTVIGRSGRGALSRLILGSVTTRVLANAASPVVAVDRRPRSAPTGRVSRVVAAVDDPSTHARTLRFAFEEAARRQVRLRVIRAVTSSENADEAQLELADAMAPWHAEFANIHGTQDIHIGPLVTVVEGVCAPDDLLVIGHHRHVPFTPHTLGWLATSVVRAAPCPVAVVHEAVDEIGLPVHEGAALASAPH